MPFGLYIGFEPESVLSVMQVLKNGIFPKTYVSEKRALGEWDIKHDWPVWGMPRGLVFDRGMAGLSHDLRQAALELGIRDVTFASARSGNQKGAVERFFRTQNQQLLQLQRGTTFSNVVERGDYDARRNAVITYSTLLKMAHRFLIDIYLRQPHTALGKDQPVQRWQRLIERYPSDPLKPIERMVHLFTKAKTVALRREGVRLHNLFFNSDELDAERLSANFAAASPRGAVLLRYDPADLGAVWVRLPHRKDRYLKVPAVPRWIDYATGRSLWEHLQILDHHRRVFGSTYDPESVAEARSALVADAAGSKRKTHAAMRKARMDGVGRTSPAGSDHATTPTGSAAHRRAVAGRPPRAANDKAVALPAAPADAVGGRRRIKKVPMGPATKGTKP